MKQRCTPRITRLAGGIFLLNAVVLHAEGRLFYKPPAVGAPSASARIGGGTRALMSDAPLQLLAPATLGLTSQASPTLYWYCAKSGSQIAEIALIRQDDNQTLLEKTLSVQNAGIQRTRLKEYGVSLPVGVEYRWSMALIADSAGSSSDFIANGTILYQPAGFAMTTAADYARAGYWYDALAKLMDDATSTAADQLDALLEQGGVELSPEALQKAH